MYKSLVGSDGPSSVTIHDSIIPLIVMFIPSKKFTVLLTNDIVLLWWSQSNHLGSSKQDYSVKTWVKYNKGWKKIISILDNLTSFS